MDKRCYDGKRGETIVTKGKPLSNKEKEYIRQHKEQKFNSQMAVELGELYPEENNGERCAATIRRFIKKED